MRQDTQQPQRCDWCGDDNLYLRYHDKEWGVPVHSDRKLFEFLILEGVQAGLSWITVLRKRPAYREAFDRFDFIKVANFNQRKIDTLLKNRGLVRNRLKMQAAVKNARAFIEVREEFGTFNRFIWQFTDGETIHNRFRSMQEVPANTPISDAMSKELKRRGFTFVGSTICYAFMQATGMVNDHLVDCYRYQQLKQ